jgi:FtsP/CotA-like multicopper oxidase with cupredoxin domain
MIVIATDGGYLVNAVSTPNLVIAPGERYEVIVDFTNFAAGSEVIMQNSARTPFPGGATPTVGGTDTVMKFIVGLPLSATPNTTIANGTPIRSTPLEPIVNGFVAGTNITRQLTLNEVIGVGGPLELVVNNSKYNLVNTPTILPGCTTPICRETELPAVGDTEIWEIINITADAHPMHTHLTTFQILDRTPFNASKWIRQYDTLLLGNGVLPGGGPPSQYNVRNADGAIGGNPAINAFLQLNKRTLPLPYEMGWKDTAIMYPGEVTRIAVRWAPQDAPVAGTACGACGTVSNPAPCPAPCMPGVGSNLYPFNPTELINGVGYVWHCHILDHEDNEMMRNYTVMETRQPVQ